MLSESTLGGRVSVIHVLDIRDDVCPITFVKTRLLIERMPVGEEGEVLLRGEEPIENVPASISELGHTVLDVSPGQIGSDGVNRGEFQVGDVRVRFRKEH
jgi:TusA-related sulfurtransferase